MQCEICGKKIDKGVYANIDGAILNVCSECSKFGQIVEKPRNIVKKKIKKPPVHRVTRIKRDSEITIEYQLKTNFNNIIKTAREKKKLKQEELALILKEKPSLISKIETGKMEPDLKLIKKLEKFLEIELTEPIQEGGSKLYAKKEELTLGDIIQIKKKKRD
ncbi:MAG: multiprotein bridging factor aMBF1 [Candidatus Odinarchaeia archaeon]